MFSYEKLCSDDLYRVSISWRICILSIFRPGNSIYGRWVSLSLLSFPHSLSASLSHELPGGGRMALVLFTRQLWLCSLRCSWKKRKLPSVLFAGVLRLTAWLPEIKYVRSYAEAYPIAYFEGSPVEDWEPRWYHRFKDAAVPHLMVWIHCKPIPSSMETAFVDGFDLWGLYIPSVVLFSLLTSISHCRLWFSDSVSVLTCAL